MQTTVITPNPLFVPVDHSQKTSSQEPSCSWSSFIPSLELTSVKTLFYTTQNYALGYSDLGKKVCEISKQSVWQDGDAEILVQAFKSKEFPKLRHLIVQILEKQPPEQINSFLKAIFRAYGFDDTKELFKKLNSLFSLQKIEKAVQAEFSHFEGVKKTADQIALTGKRNLTSKQTQEQVTFNNTIKHYVVNTIDWLVESLLFIFQLTDVTDSDATKLERQMMAQMRYQAFRENLAIISGWLIALSLYTGSFLTTSIVTALVILTTVTSYAIYAKFFKPCPEDVHPGRNRTAEASKGLIPSVHGREEMVKKLFDTLEGNTKTRARRYPLIRGGTGIGKSDLGNAMALFLTSPNCPKEWRGKKLFVVSTADIVTGGAHGKMEHLHHIKDVLKGFEDEAILFFTEVHVGFQEKTSFLGQELKTLCDGPGGFPYMIFATTDKEYMEHMAKDPAFARRLEFFDVEPTKDEETELIIRNMVACEAGDIFVKGDAIKEVSAIRSKLIEVDGAYKKVFENSPQPATSIAIVSKVLSNARHPWFKEYEKSLQELRNRRHLLDYQMKLERGINFLPYSEAGKELHGKLKALDQEIAELEKKHHEAKTELEQFRILVKKTSDLEEQIEQMAVKIKEADETGQLTEEMLKHFLLLLNYLKPALDHALEESSQRIENASVIIDKKTMETFIKEEAKSYLRKDREREESEKKARVNLDERSKKFFQMLESKQR